MGAPGDTDGVKRDDRREALAVLGIAILVLGLVAFRASRGVSLIDDTHYVNMSLRIATGAVPFVDEMSLQTLGFFVPAVFTWVWIHTAGMAGLVLAFRLFYVLAAAAVALVIYKVLRGSFRPAVAGLAALIPVISPPFNLVAPSYDTMALLGGLAALTLGFAAWRDRSRLAAAFAGAAMAFTAVSYPPLSVAVLVLLVTLLALSRDRRMVLPLLLGGTVMLAVLLGWLVPLVSIADIRSSLAYASSNVTGFSSPLQKLAHDVGQLSGALSAPTLWPMWVLAVIASLPRVTARVRAAALACIPLAGAVPGVLWLASGSSEFRFGTSAPAWLITFACGAALPVTLWARREGHAEIWRLLKLAAPSAIVGFATVAYATNASLTRAVPVIGFAPLGMVVLAGWATAVGAQHPSAAIWRTWLPTVGCTVVLLFATTFDNGRPLKLNAGFSSGPYAAIHTTAERRGEILAVQAAGAKYVRPWDRVTFMGERTAYLIMPGRPYTNAVWLYPGKTDAAALRYFAQHGAMPDVVFVDLKALRKLHFATYAEAAVVDPLLARVLEQYRLEDTVADFGIFRKR